jgi:hypothetical protein
MKTALDDAAALDLFKRQVRAFIAWMEDGGTVRCGAEALLEIEEARTFAAVQSVLAEWDDGSFLELVRAGQL